MPTFSGITHLGLPVRDLTESEQFYGEVVGFEPRGRLSPKLSCFRVCGIDLLLCEEPPGSTRAAEPVTHHSFTLEPDEWVAAVKQLHRHGVKPAEPVMYRERGYFPGRELYFFDPSGNKLEFRDETWKPGMPRPSFEEIVGKP